MHTYLHYIEQFGLFLKRSFSTISNFITLLAGCIIAMSGTQRAIWALIIVYLLDFATGILASWIEHKQNEKKAKVYFIESGKIRLSIVKAISYMLLIVFSWLIAALFFDAQIKIAYSSKQFSLVQLTAGVCIAIEIWSNLENIKRAGFDVIGKVRDIIKQVYSLKNLFNTGTNEQS